MGYHYYYRVGKLSVRREPYKRNIRVERAFGEEYSADNITKRILQNDYVWRPDIVPYRVMKVKFYSEQIRFMCKYKLETTDVVDELKTQKLREKQVILNKKTSYIITEINVVVKQIRILLLKIVFLLQICLRKLRRK